MPLLKLWNAMWGRSTGDTPVADPPVSSKLSEAAASKPASKPVSKPVSRGLSSGFNLFGSHPHAALCKQIGALPARSVLEIGVGDGSRAVAVLGTLAKSGSPVRYFGIDQFELAGGAVSLKDFHRTMRGAGIRPQIFPEPVDRGLVRFLHTVGTADLVLLDQPAETLENPQVGQLLKRISNAQTTILYLQDDVWMPLTSRTTTMLRAA